MNFPVTREYLRTCVREEIIAEKEKRQRYEFYEVLVKRICSDVENMILKSPTRETQFVWKDIEIIGRWQQCLREMDSRYSADPISYYNAWISHHYSRSRNDAPIQPWLPEFLEVLKTKFIGCDVIVDPLQTYIMIVWA